MKANPEDSAEQRWLNKKVLASRLLDDMEDPAAWSHAGLGEMSFTRERVRSGKLSLRLTAATTTGKPGPTPGRPFGFASVVRKFSPPEDWRGFNRLSFWVYPDLPGFPRANLRVRLLTASPPVSLFDQRERTHFEHLITGRWNHVLWEIGNLVRNNIAGVEITYRLQGNEPRASDRVCFAIDRLTLEKVTPDRVEGWDVAPGRIAFSHTGYQTGSEKTAVCSGCRAAVFTVARRDTGGVVLRKPLRVVASPIGKFQVMEFSELREPGEYVLRAGDVISGVFRIGDDVWNRTIWEALNFFHGERCGTSIPGIHGICHRDWQGIHGDRRIIINGGWHDAGDLSQGLMNTGRAVHAMLRLAEKLGVRGEHPELRRRLIEEARWGLDWVLKTGFDDGFRIRWTVMDFWTNGVMGDFDDMVSQAVRQPGLNFLAASVEALASRLLHEQDPVWADYCLRKARTDWRFGVEGLGPPRASAPQSTSLVRKSAGPSINLAAAGIMAAVELWKTTGEEPFRDQAAAFASAIVARQQRDFVPGWKVPLTGFFRARTSNGRLTGFYHGNARSPVAALAALCEIYPEHPEWMQWYSAVALYSEYLRRTAAFTEPYGVLPFSIYSDREYRTIPTSRRQDPFLTPDEQRASYRRQVLNGFPLGGGDYLRGFKVWYGRRGQFIDLLPLAKALSAAAQLRGKPQLANLAERQLRWIVGMNPFAQSAMYGEGYDFPPLYSAMSGQLVGGLPVGFQSRGDGDAPYWPFAIGPNYKEIYVLPVLDWLDIMPDVAGPGIVAGLARADRVIRFREISTGEVAEVRPDAGSGMFRVSLPAGRYSVQSGEARKLVRVLPGGGVHPVDLRPDRFVGFNVSQKTSAVGKVLLRIQARGRGRHRFTVRVSNLSPLPEQTLELNPATTRTVTLAAEMTDRNAPWVAVIIADGDLSEREELIGSTRAGYLPAGEAATRAIPQI